MRDQLRHRHALTKVFLARGDQHDTRGDYDLVRKLDRDFYGAVAL